jgi:GNAT superfamily N-acetyltransferase
MFVEADETADLEPPAGHGFRPVTHLAVLQRDVGPALDPAAEPLRWTPWPAAPAAEQLDLLLATHEHTQDCPELNAPRTGAEIVAGFRPTATAGRMWWSCRDGSGRPVGVLLVIGDSGPALEVSYLGLVPSARGQGLSHAILRFAERLAAASEYHTLTVSVDVRNAPAMRLYARHGFVEYDRRAVWLAAWPG